MAVLPSADSATEFPWSADPAASLPISLPRCRVQTLPLRVNIHAAPTLTVTVLLLSAGPPTMAVLPSADSPTDQPCLAAPTASLPISLPPCWVQMPLLRVKTHVAATPQPQPRSKLSEGPLSMAILPSADSATDQPWVALARAGTDQLATLLCRDTAAAGEDPRRPDRGIVSIPPYQSGVAVARQRDGEALLSAPNRAGANQLRSLLRQLRQRQLAGECPPNLTRSRSARITKKGPGVIARLGGAVLDAGGRGQGHRTSLSTKRSPECSRIGGNFVGVQVKRAKAIYQMIAITKDLISTRIRRRWGPPHSKAVTQ
jgi:hypothetical protein